MLSMTNILAPWPIIKIQERNGISGHFSCCTLNTKQNERALISKRNCAGADSRDNHILRFPMS